MAPCDAGGVDTLPLNTVVGATDVLEEAAGAAALKRAPISMPSTNSSTQSSSAQVAAMVTIREVIEKTYCCIGLYP
ncbi:hypothetical protein PQR71_28770 [Paraburkholderia fungorum]|uniref:hypothetical protein n=1 Tax=Paraburkholderia fungorum TaxID=134537 RepID=UPI0038B83881